MKLLQNQTMPDFEFLNPYKEGTQNLYSYLNGKKTAILFLRYIGCTVCRLDMHIYTQRYREFLEKDAQLIVVLQSNPNIVADEAPEGTFPFLVACDEEMKVYKEFEIEPAKNMLSLIGGGFFSTVKKMKAAKKFGITHGEYEGVEEQLPALFIVDENKNITFSHYAKNLTDMPSFDEMLKAIK